MLRGCTLFTIILLCIVATACPASHPTLIKYQYTARSPPPFNRSSKNKASSFCLPVLQVDSFSALLRYAPFRYSPYPLRSLASFISSTFSTAHKSSSFLPFRSRLPHSRSIPSRLPPLTAVVFLNLQPLPFLCGTKRFTHPPQSLHSIHSLPLSFPRSSAWYALFFLQLVHPGLNTSSRILNGIALIKK